MIETRVVGSGSGRGAEKEGAGRTEAEKCATVRCCIP